MSYILDALKKAEQERGSPQLQTVAGGRSDRTGNRYRWWPVAGAFVLCAAAMICFVLFYPKPARQMPVQSQAVAPKRLEAGPAIVPSEPKQEPAVTAIPSRAPENAQGKPLENRNRSGEPKPVQTAPKQNEPAAPRAIVQPEQSPAETSPVPLREAMQKMKITVLLYSDVPSERTVFINGRKYSEGDYVEGRYLLEKITAGGAELIYMGERALLRP
jgi:hypothetical protein